MRLILIAIMAALAACVPEPGNDRNDSAAASAPANRTAAVEVAAPPTPAAASPAALTAQGWGPLRIGMTRAEVVGALGEDANPGAVGGPDPAACDQFRPARAPEGLLVMLEKGVLTRISLARDADISTDRAIRLGDSADKVRTAYGDAIVSAPHAYLTPEGAYLTVWAGGVDGRRVSGPAARGIRYEIDARDRVSAIHAGGPSIQYVEGCA